MQFEEVSLGQLSSEKIQNLSKNVIEFILINNFHTKKIILIELGLGMYYHF